MAKPLAQILAFKPRTTQIIQFPNSQLCGCGCGTLLNKEEHRFIICGETDKWYLGEEDFLEDVKAVELNGRYHFTDDSWDSPYRYTRIEFYKEMKASWNEVLVPIA